MVGLGIGIGVVFPFAIVPFGVPVHTALRVEFFVGTVSAGLIVGGANFFLARRVVGRRLGQLSAQMAHVGGVITDSTASGDWSRCDPETCALPVDSADEMGGVARSFNELLTALAGSHQIEDAMSTFSATLVQHLAVDEVVASALDGFIQHSGAAAGAVAVVREGDITVEADYRLEGEGLDRSALVRSALESPVPTVINVPEGLMIEAALLRFRPDQVILIPLTFKTVPVGVVILAFAREISPGRLRLLESLGHACGVALNNALTHERLQRLAAVDPLTGAYNRRFGDSRLQEEWARCVRTTSPLGLISFDIDHFKEINDTHGHLMGDLVLKELVAATRTAMREGDVLVRLGGDEFLVILPGAGRFDVEAVGDRIRRLVAAPSGSSESESIQVTVSLAALSWPDMAANGTDDLLAALDAALYESKDQGRDRLTLVATNRLVAPAIHSESWQASAI